MKQATLSPDDAAAHMYPSDLKKFEFGEHVADAFSIAVGCPDEVSVPLFTTTQAEAYADARVAESQQWHPIETAPKDGTWILAINAAKNPGRQHVVHYSERWGNHYPWVTGSAPMDFVAGVTHWMPLPTPPLPGPVEPTT